MPCFFVPHFEVIKKQGPRILQPVTPISARRTVRSVTELCHGYGYMVLNSAYTGRSPTSLPVPLN